MEAACLAHDLGHPPFGHLGEKVLNDLVLDAGNGDGFEGNAQSFRVLTKLAVRYTECQGLDLTRATLAASIKYPWVRDADHPRRKDKWGYYASEQDDFEFARALQASEIKTAEAELMDWADDIAYSVHDLEDFHRCNAIPWHRIFDRSEKEKLVDNTVDAWPDAPVDGRGRLREAYDRISDFFTALVPDLIGKPYEATVEPRQQVRLLTSQLIGRYIHAIELVVPGSDNERCVVIGDDEEDEIRILKQICRDYIISNPALAAQQRGHERIMRNLFGDLLDDARGENPRYIPRKFAYFLDSGGADAENARAVADCISSLTEAEAIALHSRLRGVSSGSVLDPIVR